MHQEKGIFSKGTLSVISLMFLTATAVLPLVFFPGLPLGTSKWFVVAITAVIALLLFLADKVKTGSITLPIDLSYVALVLIPLSYLASAFLNGLSPVSIAGRSFEFDTFLSALLFSVIVFLVSLSVSKKQILLRFLGALVLSSGIAALFLLFRTIVLPENIFSNLVSLVGTWGDTAIFFALSVTICLNIIELLPLKKEARAVVYGVLILSLLWLLVANSVIAWALTGVSSLVLLVLLLAKGRSKEEESSLSVVPVLPLLLFIVAFFMILSRGTLGGFFSEVFEVNYVDVRPSWESTTEVIRESITTNPLFGTGPATFTNTWLVNKAPDINQTVFWNIDFNTGIGRLPTAVATVGLFGLLAWILLLASLVYVLIRLNRVMGEDTVSRFLFSTFLGAMVVLWGSMIFYVPSITVVALTFIFTGLLLGFAVEQGVISHRTFYFATKEKGGLVGVVVVVALLVASVGWAYLYTEQFISRVHYAKASDALRVGDVALATERIQAALRFHPSDEYYRLLSQIYQSQTVTIANQLTQQEEPSQEGTQLLQQSLTLSISYAQSALQFDDKNYLNVMMLADSYATASLLGVEGAYERAKETYQQAERLAPFNPGINLALARLEMSQQKGDAAREQIRRAIEKKPNFAQAAHLLSQIQIQEGEIEEAVQSLLAVAQLEPGNPTAYFQIGLLYYNGEQYSEAATSFERALSIDSQFANAKYFLGLVYGELDKVTEAVSLFEELKIENPDNQELDTIISNLKTGKDVLEGFETTSPEEVSEDLPEEIIEEDILEEESSLEE